MDIKPPLTTPDFDTLPDITLRQLQVFTITCRERSYAGAAIDLHSTRANIKRLIHQFEKALGGVLFEEDGRQKLQPTLFAQGVLMKLAPLSRSLRRLEEGIGALHANGRILRCATAGDLFRGGLFTSVLNRMNLSGLFRPCFLKIEPERFQTALMNMECDAYFGVGLEASERLVSVDVGEVPWRVLCRSGQGEPPPDSVSMLQGEGWHIGAMGRESYAHQLLEEWRRAGATGGKVMPEAIWSAYLAEPALIPSGQLVFVPDMSMLQAQPGWPAYRFMAVIRSNHPYVELKALLAGMGGRHGS